MSDHKLSICIKTCHSMTISKKSEDRHSKHQCITRNKNSAIDVVISVNEFTELGAKNALCDAIKVIEKLSKQLGKDSEFLGRFGFVKNN